MAPGYPQLTRFLDAAGTDGYLIDGEDSNQYYLSGFCGSSVTLYTDGAVRLLVPDLEYTRASSDSDADSVRRFSEFGYRSTVNEHSRRGVAREYWYPQTPNRRLLRRYKYY